MSKKNKRNNKRENVENVNMNVTAQMVAGIKIDRVDLSRIASACESMACLLLDHGDTLADAFCRRMYLRGPFHQQRDRAART